MKKGIGIPVQLFGEFLLVIREIGSGPYQMRFVPNGANRFERLDLHSPDLDDPALIEQPATPPECDLPTQQSRLQYAA